MPGNSPARAFKRNWYCRPPTRHVVSAGNIEKESTLTYPTQTKLAHHTTSTASSRTAIFDRRRPRVATEGIQLELCLIAHLGGETLVACDIEVCAARDLIVGNALSRFDVAQDACIWSRRHSGGKLQCRFGYRGKVGKQTSHNNGFLTRVLFFFLGTTGDSRIMRFCLVHLDSIGAIHGFMQFRSRTENFSEQFFG
jgi:hypothetical protein